MSGTTITIEDIAAELGVSKTTVSRAISGKGRIGQATRERVLSYISEHNYKPSAIARGLAQQKTFNIGVVCPTDYEIFDYPFFHMCLRGISEVTSESGYDILITMVEGSDISNLRRIVENRKVDGMILTRTVFDDPLAEYLKKSGILFVAIGSSPDKELVQIDNDHLSGCRELTGVLIGKGLRRLALIGCDERQVITDTRRRGFLDAYEKAGLIADPSIIYMDADSEQRVLQIVRDALQKKAEGVVCMDEQITGYVLAACRKLKIKLPEELKVASFYDSSFLDSAVPAITALDIDDRELGSAAAKTLLDMIAGEDAGSRILKNYQIILRESTS